MQQSGARGEKVAFFCLLQAGERNFLSSYSRNLGFVDLPSPVLNVSAGNQSTTCSEWTIDRRASQRIRSSMPNMRIRSDDKVQDTDAD